MRASAHLIAAAIGLAALSAAPAPAAAQAAAALGDGPLSLDAADGVEWRREERLFIAEGEAVASQGDVTLAADRLVAAYRDGAGGKFEIFRLDAEGKVNISNGEDTAAATRAAFDLDRRAIVMSGPGLRYTTGQVVVTADETLEYLLDERRAVARGGAKVVDPRGALTAETIEAQLAPGASAGVSVARAWGDVTIRTERETIRADRAEYDFNARRAVAIGDVRVARGEDVLTGARATVDLESGVSRLDGGDGGRVKGLIFPKADR